MVPECVLHSVALDTSFDPFHQNLVSKIKVSHIEELFHELSVRMQVSPGQAAEVCVVQVQQVLWCAGGGAALTVLHQTQPQSPSLTRQQAV